MPNVKNPLSIRMNNITLATLLEVLEGKGDNPETLSDIVNFALNNYVDTVAPQIKHQAMNPHYLNRIEVMRKPRGKITQVAIPNAIQSMKMMDARPIEGAHQTFIPTYNRVDSHKSPAPQKASTTSNISSITPEDLGSGMYDQIERNSLIEHKDSFQGIIHTITQLPEEIEKYNRMVNYFINPNINKTVEEQLNDDTPKVREYFSRFIIQFNIDHPNIVQDKNIELATKIMHDYQEDGN